MATNLHWGELKLLPSAIEPRERIRAIMSPAYSKHILECGHHWIRKLLLLPCPIGAGAEIIRRRCTLVGIALGGGSTSSTGCSKHTWRPMA